MSELQHKCKTEDLLELALSLGYHLQNCGAEISRVEEAVNRLLFAYGMPGDVFAIPNCLMVTICPDSGEPMTRIRRVNRNGTDIDGIERFYALGRRLCAETPDMDTARQLLQETKSSLRTYPRTVLYAGYFLVAGAFAVHYGGTILDGLLAGLCGVVTGFFLRSLTKLKVNGFFQTITAAFWIAMCCRLLTLLGWMRYGDSAAIGALMLLVPGMTFTDSMRDILYGDTYSGINKLVQVLLTAAALFLGTGAALRFSYILWSVAPVSPVHAPWDGWIQVVMAALACGGFCLLYNIRGPGIFVCMAGGGIGWASYLLTKELFASSLLAYFLSAATVSLYAEVMARVRKFPAFSYLVIALLPAVPGAGVYYTMELLLLGEVDASLAKGVETASIAGLLAVGVLLVSSLFRMGRVAGELLQEKHNRT